MIKRRKSKKLIACWEQHEAFLKAIGYNSNRKKTKPKPKTKPSKLKTKRTPLKNDPLLQKMFGVPGGFKQSLDDWRWKKGRMETKETIEAIEQKKRQVRPAFNKGGLQLISEKEEKNDF